MVYATRHVEFGRTCGIGRGCRRCRSRRSGSSDRRVFYDKSSEQAKLRPNFRPQLPRPVRLQVRRSGRALPSVRGFFLRSPLGLQSPRFSLHGLSPTLFRPVPHTETPSESLGGFSKDLASSSVVLGLNRYFAKKLKTDFGKHKLCQGLRFVFFSGNKKNKLGLFFTFLSLFLIRRPYAGGPFGRVVIFPALKSDRLFVEPSKRLDATKPRAEDDGPQVMMFRFGNTTSITFKSRS